MNPEKHLAKNNQSPEKLSDDIEIKKAKLHVLKERILEKQELYQNNKYKDIDIEQLESDLVEYEKIKNELMGNIDSISPEQALEIMGEDLYLGPSDIEKTFNFTPEDIPNIPFSKERLDNARELGQQLILYVDSLDDKTPFSVNKIEEILNNKTNKGNKFLYDSGWYTDDSETKDITPRLGWRLTTPEIIDDSNNKNYLEQTEHLITYLTNTVYKESEIPEIYQTAIDEFKNIDPEMKRQAQLEYGDWDKLSKSDKLKLAEYLTNLSINQLIRENYTEIIYRLALNEKKSGIQNLENSRSWSNSIASGGKLVNVGLFDSEGLLVYRWLPGYRHGGIGVCFSAGE